jgi:hypothetical protein
MAIHFAWKRAARRDRRFHQEQPATRDRIPEINCTPCIILRELIAGFRATVQGFCFGSSRPDPPVRLASAYLGDYSARRLQWTDIVPQKVGLMTLGISFLTWPRQH